MTDTTAVPRARIHFIHDSVNFYQHQADGVRRGARMSSFLLADEMGLGKSLQALTVAAVDAERRPWRARIIVICPATLKGNWADEVEKFSKFRAMVLNGDKKKRSKQLDAFRDSLGTDSPYHVLIINYEQAKAHLDEINDIGFYISIYDEAHWLKNPKAARTVAAHAIQARRSFMLTGSPMLNHVHELWSILYRINPDAFPNYYAFLHRYVVFGGYKGKQPVGVKNEAELRDRLGSVMIRRTKDEVLDLPPKHRIVIPVELLPEQKKVYRQVRDELQLILPDDPTPVEIENVLHRFTILKQAAATLACFEGMDDVSAKLDEAVERWLELYDSGHKVVMFTQFRPVLAAMEARIASATGKGSGLPAASPYTLHGDVPIPKRQPVIADWTADKKPNPVLCMLQVAGVGLNMTASRHLFFLDKLFVPKLNEQAEDRCHRIGADTTQPVTIFEFLARGTVEHRIETILREKSALFGAVVDDVDFKKKLVKMLLEDDV